MFRSNIKFFLAFFIATTLFAVVQVYAVWTDAPAAPAQYGTVSGTTQEDYKPVNLGDATQTKTGGLNIMGNVGIGTTGPGAKLTIASTGGGLEDVDGDAEVHIGTSLATPNTAGEKARLAIQPYGHTGGPFNIIARDTPGFAFLDIRYGPLTEPTLFTLRNDGNVGIGTITPYAKLQIDMQNLATTEGLHISRTSPTSYSYLNIEDENSSPIFKVHQSGNVGIGTTTPAYKLGVNGDISATQLCIAGDCKSSWADVVSSNIPNLQAVTDIGTSTTNVIGASGFYDAQDSDYYIDPNGTGNSAVLRGKVGIGTTDPGAYKLNVQSGQINASGGLCIAGSCITAWPGSCVAGSSIRAIASNGGVTCEQDDIGATYTAGAGLALSDNKFSLNMGSQSCSGNQKVSSISTTGAIGCSNDIDTTGVTSVNSKTGAVSIAAGSGININNAGSSIVINSTVGSGNTNYIAKWTSASTLGDSIIQDNGTNVGIGVAPGTFKLAVNGQVRANDLIGSDNLRIAGSGNDKHVAILGGGTSNNEGAAIYVRGRWDTTGPIAPSPGGQAGILQVFTPNTSAVAVERFRIESGDDPDVRIMNSFLNISEVTSFLSSTCDTSSEYGRLAYKNEQSTIPSIGATIKSWELSLCTEYDGWEHVSSKCTCLSGCSSCSIISP